MTMPKTKGRGWRRRHTY